MHQIMASKDALVEIPEKEDQWVGAGPQNSKEARSYHEKVDTVYEMFSELLTNDVKDALQKTVTSFKKVMAKHWVGMAEADLNNIMKTIRDPSCLHLCQFLSTDGVTVTELASDIPEGWEFLRSLPEKNRKHEECQLIISIFNHISEAMAHSSMTAANILALGKITDPQTFDQVL